VANKLYPLARNSFANAGINWGSDTIKVAAIKSGYTFSNAHQFVTDLGANIVARSSALSSKTSVGGILNAAQGVFAALTGAQVLFLVVFKDTGTDATSPLLYYIDTATNMPFTPNGIDVDVQWDPTTGIFQV
jgi:hypothetical protein